MPNNLPGGNSLFAWLGRQVGYVKKAVQTDPAAAIAQTKPPSPSVPKPEPAADAHTRAQNEPTVIYRDGKVEEAPHPTEPGMKLRRTVIDEVIVERPEGRDQQ